MSDLTRNRFTYHTTEELNNRLELLANIDQKQLGMALFRLVAMSENCTPEQKDAIFLVLSKRFPEIIGALSEHARAAVAVAAE